MRSPALASFRTNAMRQGGAVTSGLEGATMHEYGLEHPGTKTRTGWLSRARGSPRTRGRPKLIRRVRTSHLNLALQGGGAHGAFTWGVLDRLLEAERFRYEGISGTSAGAINAVVFASG
jgi:Patatin-like phospholipase